MPNQDTTKVIRSVSVSLVRTEGSPQPQLKIVQSDGDTLDALRMLSKAAHYLACDLIEERDHEEASRP